MSNLLESTEALVSALETYDAAKSRGARDAALRTISQLTPPAPALDSPDADKAVREAVASVRSAGPPPPGGARLLPHQAALRRSAGPWSLTRGALLYHAMGTGKTCSALAVADVLEPYMDRVLLVSSRNVRARFLDEMRDGCARTARVRRIKTIGYTAFSNRLEAVAAVGKRRGAGYGDAAASRMGRALEGTLLIIDEAHNLRNSHTKTLLENLVSGLKMCKTARVLLLTATPMFDRHTEMLDIIRIINAVDKKPDIDSLKGPEFERWCQQYVSYVPLDGGESMPRVEYAPSQGVPSALREAHPERSSEGIQFHGMGVEQKAVYGRPRVSLNIRTQAANCAFPGAKVGRLAFLAHYDIANTRVVPRLDGGHPLGAETLRQYSPKVAAIVEDIKARENQVVVVYSRFLYSGILLVAAALEEIGFRRSPGGGAPSYVILSGNAQLTPDPAEDLAACRSDENVDGSLVRVDEALTQL